MLRQLEEQESLISKARKLFADDQLNFDNFRDLKKKYKDTSGILKKEINSITNKLEHIAEVNFQTGDVSILMNSALVKILCHKKQIVFKSSSMNNILSDRYNFTVRNISLKRAVEILSKNNIEVNDSEAAIILDFIYNTIEPLTSVSQLIGLYSLLA